MPFLPPACPSGGCHSITNMTMSNNNLASSDSLLAYCLAQSSAAYNATSNNATTDATNDHNNTILLLDCITRALQNDAFHTLSFARSVLLVYAAALVFFMQAGFAMVCAGAVRTKNVQNTLLKNLLDACGASIAFFSVGYAFAFGGAQADNPTKTFLGTSQFFLMNVDDLAFWLFQYAFSAASATIIAGTLAERCQMTAYLCYSVMLVGWVYPIILHAIWNPQGFLCAYSVDPLWGVGMVDFAGSGVVHLTGGITALFATIILGPRRGRFHDETGRRLKVPRDFPGHSMSLQMLGTIILWFGWYGFNCGSALTGTGDEIATVVALAGVNSTMSGGTAGIVALFVNLYLLERYTGEPYFDLKYAMNGSLSGLVAITGSCGVVEPWAACLIGAIAGLIYIGGSKALLVLRLDDAVDAIPVHMLCGMWGLIAGGLFASPHRLQAFYHRSDHPGWFYTLTKETGSDATLLGVQLIGMLFIIGWVICVMLPFFVWLDWKGWFRSDPLEEIVGLDTSYHGGLALLGGNRHDDVNPEYITAYKKQRLDQLRQRRRSPHYSDTVQGDSDIPDDDGDEEDNHSVVRRRGRSPRNSETIQCDSDIPDEDGDEEYANHAIGCSEDEVEEPHDRYH